MCKRLARATKTNSRTASGRDTSEMGGGSGSGSGEARAARNETPAPAPSIWDPLAFVGRALAGDAAPAAASTAVHHVLELGNLPEGAAALPEEQRFKLVK
jgi:hypothetical protein